jgi:hypothetical protein
MPKGISLTNFISWCNDKKNTLYRRDLEAGDIVHVMTINSMYRLHVLDGGMFAVSGGWFDRHGLSPFVTTIAGCTFGGSMINITAVAACGLCIEFGNRVRTSCIRKVIILHHSSIN